MEAKRAKGIAPSALQKPERRHSGVVSSSLTSNLNAIAAKNNANAAFASITCAVSGSPQFRTSSAPMLMATGRASAVLSGARTRSRKAYHVNASTRRYNQRMTLKGKILFHQVHPAKLGTDII